MAESIKHTGSHWELNLKRFEWVDHGHVMLYLPSLNISAYGQNLQAALEMLDFSVEEFFHNLSTLTAKNILEELNKLGWEVPDNDATLCYSRVYVDKAGWLHNFDLDLDDATKVVETAFSRAF